MVKEGGGHSNYNANMGMGTRRSYTFAVAKMPLKMQRVVLDLVR